jgi:hypothetical protein
MPFYVRDALKSILYTPTTKAQQAPHPWVKPTFGQKIQLTEPEDESELLNAKEVHIIQKIIGKFYYYARAVDHTMLVALGELATRQTEGVATKQVAEDVTHFLNYAATHPNAAIKYHASGMVLHVDSDASYLSVRKARSRVGGHHYLSSASADSTKAPVNDPPPNGPLHAVCASMKNVMASAAEAEMGGLFTNGQEAVILRTTLEELGHRQPPTPIKTDNSTASGIANKSIRQRRSRSMDMRFYWVRDRVQQGQFIIYWKPGTENKGDFYTKHHPPTHCRLHRKHYVHEREPDKEDGQSHRVLQGCANLGISLGTRAGNQGTRAINLTTISGTQNEGLTISPTIGKYLTKYRRPERGTR